MSPTRLGLIGLLALVFILGGMALGHVIADAAEWPVGVGQLVGLALGFLASTVALRRAYSGG